MVKLYRMQKAIMKVKLTCPLGSTCEEAKEGYIERCMWYTKIAGVTPEGKEVDEWSCAITWMPTLQLEMARTNIGQTRAIESMRNETLKRQDKALELVNVRNLTN